MIKKNVMRPYPIEWFGKKLMVASKAINTIPDMYMSYSRNARIFDWWIGPRRGKQLLTNSVLWTNNKWAFYMWGTLYQVANSTIYSVDLITWVQTSKASVWYDLRTDILVYQPNIAIIASEWQELAVFNWSIVSLPSTVPSRNLGTMTVTIASPWVFTLNNHGLWVWDAIYITTTWALPTGLSASTKYYVISAGLTTNTFEVSAIKGGVAINTTWTQSWVHTLFQYYNSGIIEYCRGFSFLASKNILYISRPITPTNPEYSYDFVWSGSQQITYDTNIIGLIATMSGIYIFTEDKLEYLGANALQNVAWSATFISTPIGRWSQPVNNLCIAADWEKIFYLTKNLQVQTVNYMQGTIYTSIAELSARPVISIKEFLNTVDTNQPTSYAFLNENDKTIQMHIRSVGSPFNDYVLVYDLVNDTWNIDTNKNFNYMVKVSSIYYWFSDVNTSIYQDDVWFSDAGIPMDFRIDTQNMEQWSPNQKIYWGLYLMGWIWLLSTINVTANIDLEPVFQDLVSWDANNIPFVWEIGDSDIWWEMIWWPLTYVSKLYPFDRRADVWRIYKGWKRMQISFTSNSQIQDFILDTCGLYFQPTSFIDIPDVW